MIYIKMFTHAKYITPFYSGVPSLPSRSEYKSATCQPVIYSMIAAAAL